MGNILSCFKPTKEVKRPLIKNDNYQQHDLNTTDVVFKLTNPFPEQDFICGV